MAVDTYLFLQDIKGESQDDKYKDSIEIIAFNWGAKNEGTAHTGTGAGAGKAQFQDLTIDKRVDKSSPTLLQFLATGRHIDNGSVIMRKSGGEQMEYFKIEMKGIFVTGYSVSGSDGDTSIEKVTLNFSKFRVTYTPQTASGTKGSSTDFGYDIPANKPAFG